MKISILIIGMCFFGCLYAQPEIDYGHKVITKTLQNSEIGNDFELVEVPMDESLKSKFRIDGKFFEVEISHSAKPGYYVYIGRVNSCRATGCSVFTEDDSRGDSEYFDYMIIYDSVATIVNTKVFNYQATHGYEIAAKGWLKQFEGYAMDKNLKVGKEVDAIAGATISVYAITYDVQMKTEILNGILGE